MEIRNTTFRFWALIIVALAALLCGFSVCGTDSSDAETIKIAQGETYDGPGIGQKVINNTSGELEVADGVFTFCGKGHESTESITIGDWEFSGFYNNDDAVGFTFTIHALSDGIGLTTISCNGDVEETIDLAANGRNTTIGNRGTGTFEIDVNTTDTVNGERIYLKSGILYQCHTYVFPVYATDSSGEYLDAFEGGWECIGVNGSNIILDKGTASLAAGMSCTAGSNKISVTSTSGYGVSLIHSEGYDEYVWTMDLDTGNMVKVDGVGFASNTADHSLTVSGYDDGAVKVSASTGTEFSVGSNTYKPHPNTTLSKFPIADGMLCLDSGNKYLLVGPNSTVICSYSSGDFLIKNNSSEFASVFGSASTSCCFVIVDNNYTGNIVEVYAEGDEGSFELRQSATLTSSSAQMKFYKDHSQIYTGSSTVEMKPGYDLDGSSFSTTSSATVSGTSDGSSTEYTLVSGTIATNQKFNFGSLYLTSNSTSGSIITYDPGNGVLSTSLAYRSFFDFYDTADPDSIYHVEASLNTSVEVKVYQNHKVELVSGALRLADNENTNYVFPEILIGTDTFVFDDDGASVCYFYIQRLADGKVLLPYTTTLYTSTLLSGVLTLNEGLTVYLGDDSDNIPLTALTGSLALKNDNISLTCSMGNSCEFSIDSVEYGSPADSDSNNYRMYEDGSVTMLEGAIIVAPGASVTAVSKNFTNTDASESMTLRLGADKLSITSSGNIEYCSTRTAQAYEGGEYTISLAINGSTLSTTVVLESGTVTLARISGISVSVNLDFGGYTYSNDLDESYTVNADNGRLDLLGGSIIAPAGASIDCLGRTFAGTGSEITVIYSESVSIGVSSTINVDDPNLGSIAYQSPDSYSLLIGFNGADIWVIGGGIVLDSGKSLYHHDMVLYASEDSTLSAISGDLYFETGGVDVTGSVYVKGIGTTAYTKIAGADVEGVMSVFTIKLGDGKYVVSLGEFQKVEVSCDGVENTYSNAATGSAYLYFTTGCSWVGETGSTIYVSGSLYHPDGTCYGGDFTAVINADSANITLGAGCSFTADSTALSVSNTGTGPLSFKVAGTELTLISGTVSVAANTNFTYNSRRYRAVTVSEFKTGEASLTLSSGSAGFSSDASLTVDGVEVAVVAGTGDVVVTTGTLNSAYMDHVKISISKDSVQYFDCQSAEQTVLFDSEGNVSVESGTITVPAGQEITYDGITYLAIEDSQMKFVTGIEAELISGKISFAGPVIVGNHTLSGELEVSYSDSLEVSVKNGSDLTMDGTVCLKSATADVVLNSLNNDIAFTEGTATLVSTYPVTIGNVRISTDAVISYSPSGASGTDSYPQITMSSGQDVTIVSGTATTVCSSAGSSCTMWVDPVTGHAVASRDVLDVDGDVDIYYSDTENYATVTGQVRVEGSSSAVSIILDSGNSVGITYGGTSREYRGVSASSTLTLNMDDNAVSLANGAVNIVTGEIQAGDFTISGIATVTMSDQSYTLAFAGTPKVTVSTGSTSYEYGSVVGGSCSMILSSGSMPQLDSGTVVVSENGSVTIGSRIVTADSGSVTVLSDGTLNIPASASASIEFQVGSITCSSATDSVFALGVVSVTYTSGTGTATLQSGNGLVKGVYTYVSDAGGTELSYGTNLGINAGAVIVSPGAPIEVSGHLVVNRSAAEDIVVNSDGTITVKENDGISVDDILYVATNGDTVLTVADAGVRIQNGYLSVAEGGAVYAGDIRFTNTSSGKNIVIGDRGEVSVSVGASVSIVSNKYTNGSDSQALTFDVDLDTGVPTLDSGTAVLSPGSTISNTYGIYTAITQATIAYEADLSRVFVLSSGSVYLTGDTSSGLGHDIKVGDVEIVNRSDSVDIAVSADGSVSAEAGCKVSIGDDAVITAITATELVFDTEGAVTVVSGEVGLESGNKVSVGTSSFVAEEASTLNVQDSAAELVSGTVSVNGTVSANGVKFTGTDLVVTFGSTTTSISLVVVSGNVAISDGSSSRTYVNASDSSENLELRVDASCNVELISGTITSASAFDILVNGSTYPITAGGSVSYSSGSACPNLVSGSVGLSAGDSIMVGPVTVSNESQAGTITVSSDSKVVLGSGQSVKLVNGEMMSALTAVGATTITFDSDTNITVVSGTVQLERGQTLTVDGVDYAAEAQSTLSVSGTTVELVSGTVRFDGKLKVAEHSIEGRLLVSYSEDLVLTMNDCTITLDGNSYTTSAEAVLKIVSGNVYLQSGSLSFSGTVSAGGIIFEGSMSVEMSDVSSDIVLRMSEDGSFKISFPGSDAETYRHIHGGHDLEMVVSSDGSVTIDLGSVVILEGKTFKALGAAYSAKTESRVNILMDSEGVRADRLEILTGTLSVGPGVNVCVGDVTVTNSGETAISVDSAGKVVFEGDGSVTLVNGSNAISVDAASSSVLKFDNAPEATLVSGTFQLIGGTHVVANSVRYDVVSDSTLTVTSSGTSLCKGEVGFDGKLNVLGMLFDGPMTVKLADGSDSVSVSVTGTDQFRITADSVERCYTAVDDGAVTSVDVSSSGIITITQGAVGVPAGTVVALGPGNGRTVTDVILQKGSFILREGTMEIDPGVSIVVDSVTITNNSNSGTVSITADRTVEMDAGQTITMTAADGTTKDFTATSRTSAKIDEDLNVDIESGDVYLDAGDSATIEGIEFTAVAYSHISVTDGVIELIEGSVRINGGISIKVGTCQVVLDSAGSNVLALGTDGSVTISLSAGSRAELTLSGSSHAVSAIESTAISVSGDKVTISSGKFKLESTGEIYLSTTLVSCSIGGSVTATVGGTTNGIFFDVAEGSLNVDGTRYSCVVSGGFSLEVYGSDVTLASGSVEIPEGATLSLNGGSVECTAGTVTVKWAEAANDAVVGICSASSAVIRLEGRDEQSVCNSGSDTDMRTIGELSSLLGEFQQFVTDEKDIISSSASEVDPAAYYLRIDGIVYDVGKSREDNESAVTAIVSEYFNEVNIDVMTQFQNYKTSLLLQIDSMHKAGEIQSLKNRIDEAYSKASAIFYQDDPLNDNKAQVLLANKARLDEVKSELQAYIDADVETVRAAREYWESVCSSILLLHIGETCIGEKNAVDAAYSRICVDDGQGNLSPAPGYEFVPGTSLRVYQDLLDSVIADCNDALSPYRNDAGEFNSYRDIMAEYIAGYDAYNSDEIRALIDKYHQKVSDLRYDSELSLSGNIFRVDSLVSEFESAANKLCASSFDSARSAALETINGIAADYLDPEVREMISDAEKAVRTYSYDSSKSYKANAAHLNDLVTSLRDNIELMLKNKVDYFNSYRDYYADPDTGKIPAVIIAHPEYASNEKIMAAINSTLDAIRPLEYNHKISSAENIQIIANAVSGLEVTLYGITLESAQKEFAEYKAEAVKYVQGKVKEGNTFAISEYVGDTMKRINGIAYDTDLSPADNKAHIDEIIEEFDEKIVVLAGRAQYDATVDSKILELYEYFPDAGTTVNAKIESLRIELYGLYDVSADLDEALAKLSARLETGFKEVYQLWDSGLRSDFSDYRAYLSWCIADEVKLLPTEAESSLAAEYRAKIEATGYDAESSYLWNKYVLDSIYKEFQKKYSEIALEEGKKVFESQRALNITALRAYADGTSPVDSAIADGVSKINALRYDVNTDKKANLVNMSDAYSAAEVHVRYALCQTTSDLDGYIDERSAYLHKVYADYDAEVTELIGSMKAVLTQSISVRAMAEKVENLDSTFKGTTDKKVILGSYYAYKKGLMDKVYSSHTYGESSKVTELLRECYGLLEASTFDEGLTFEGNVARLDSIYDDYSNRVYKQKLHDNSVVSGDLTADMTNLSTGQKADYPEGCTDIWGIIANDKGLENTTVTFERTEVPEDVFSSGRKVMNAEGSVATVLADGKQIGAFDIVLYNNGSKVTSFDGTYCIKILLPEDMRGYSTVQVAYIDSYGDLQIYDAEIEDNFLVFYTTHFSTFYLVGVESSGITHYDAYVFAAIAVIVLAVFLYFVRIVAYVPNAAECRTVPSVYFGEPEGTLGSRFERPGYRLVGWSRTQDGSGDVIPVDGEVTILGKFHAVKLYAVWEKTGGEDDQ